MERVGRERGRFRLVRRHVEHPLVRHAVVEEVKHLLARLAAALYLPRSCGRSFPWGGTGCTSLVARV
jgi:hypothetical protein